MALIIFFVRKNQENGKQSSFCKQLVLKQEIYHLLDEFVRAGGAAIVVSSEAPELLHLSDRIAVFKGGRLVTVSTDTALSQVEQSLPRKVHGIGQDGADGLELWRRYETHTFSLPHRLGDAQFGLPSWVQ